MPIFDETTTQSALIESLQKAAFYPHQVAEVEHRQTHISHILLAGDYAYKIKKPVNFGFVDFTSLERRHLYCAEELRLNRRLAPDLYLDCVAIGGSPEQPQFGGSPAIEYAVRMRRFPQAALLDQVLNAGELTVHHIEDLAQQIATFQSAIPVAPLDSGLGHADQVLQLMFDNFTHTRPLLDDAADVALLSELETWTLQGAAALRPRLAARQSGAWIREGHGDLHLGNMILTASGQIATFDCIEFNDTLRWIDTINEIAFLTMDLQARGAGYLAQRFLSSWLEYSGDFAGLELLRPYQVYRAMVRAKINAIQSKAADMRANAQAAALAECRSYLQLAKALTKQPERFLLITHGVSGSGKSRRTGQLVEVLPGAIRIRADVERKRLFGLAPLADSRSSLGAGLYSPEASARTYQRLLELAEQLLELGYPVMVDATFLRRAYRQPFAELAARIGVPFTVLDCNQTDAAVLRERVAARQLRGDDAAEATLAVLERQLQCVEAPSADEHVLKTSDDQDISTLEQAILGTTLIGRTSHA